MKRISLTVLSILMIAYFAFLSAQYIAINTQYGNNDYPLFYTVMRSPNSLYHYFTIANQYRLISTENNQIKVQVISPGIGVNMNTPLMSFFIKGMVNISDQLEINTTAWVLISLLCAMIGLYYLMRWMNDVSPPVYYFFPALLLLWLSRPSLINLASGEISLFLLPFLCVAFYFISINRKKEAAILLGFLAGLKLFFLIMMFYYGVKQRWQYLFIFLASFLVSSCLPLLYFPWSEYLAFFAMLQDKTLLITHAKSFDSGSLLTFLCYVFIKLKQIQQVTLLYVVNIIISFTIILGYCLYDYQRVRHLSVYSDALRFGFFVVIGLICSPLAWLYYFVYLIVPVFVLIKVARDYRFRSFFFIKLGIAILFMSFSKTTEYCLFLSLLFWLLCLTDAVRVVSTQQKEKSNSAVILMAMLIFSAVLNLGLFVFHYNAYYFLNANKNVYLNNMGRTIWIKDK